MLISLIVSAEISDSYGFNILAAQLKKLQDRGVKTQLFYIFHDFNKSYPQSVINDLRCLCRGSDLIGVSLLSSAFKNSVQITETLKQDIGCPIIWGGKHPTADPNECIKHADILAISEGEDTLLEIVERMLDNKSYDNVLGTWVKSNGNVIKNDLRPIENNLDRFLFPDYSLEDKYVLDKTTWKIRPIYSSDIKEMIKRYPTMITRGCPNCCTFCTNSTDFRLRKMRSRSVDNVIEEVKNFMSIYPGVKKVMFRDDCISAMPMSFIEEFAEKWKKEIGLPCGVSGVIATSEEFDKKISLLAKAGMSNFKMGIQSGCERVRRFVFARVGETDEVIMNAISSLRRADAGKLNYYMITDNPYETEDELIESIRFTSRIPRPFSLSLYSLNFYPGTGLYIRALSDGRLTNKESALQESTMHFKDTYLNKIFIMLRYFEIHPYVIRMLTDKRIYKNKYYKNIFNLFFILTFRTSKPSRFINKPSILREMSNFKRGRGFDIIEVFRMIIWEAIESVCILFHRISVK